MKRTLAAIALALCFQSASAASIMVTSIGWSQVQVVINGTSVRTLYLGEVSPEGVKLVETNGDSALFEINGKPVRLALGQSTLAETVLRANSAGHFLANALVNGIPVRGVIDTGASYVALNWEHAERMGIDRRQGQRVWMNTANGRVPATLVTLASVQVGDIGLFNVPGVVVDGGDEILPVVLIGMSFLRHVDMRRSGNTMTLSRPQ